MTTKITDYVFAGIMGLCSLIDFSSYAAKSNAPEYQILKQTASYSQSENVSLKERVDNAKQSLETFSKYNSQKIPELSGIESKLSKLSEDVNKGANPQMYEPLVKSIGGELELVLSKYQRNGWELGSGILTGLCALIWLYSGLRKE